MRFIICLCTALLVVGCSDKRGSITVPGSTTPIGSPSQQSDVQGIPTPTFPAKKTYSREEFKTLVIGKTEEEVIKAVGKPDKTGEGIGDPRWVYYDKTIDAVTSKADSISTIYFKDGKVDRVSY